MMLRIFAAFALFTLVPIAPTAAIAETPVNEAATPEGLVAAGERWRILYEAGEWETLRTLYTDDAVLMSQGQPKISGADNIVAFLKRLGDMGASATFQFAPEEAVIENGLGFVIATYRMEIAMPERPEPAVAIGRSMLIYKWTDDGWKLWRDMDNFAPDVSAGDFE